MRPDITNDYWEKVKDYVDKGIPHSLDQLKFDLNSTIHSHVLRDEMVRKYAWSITDPTTVAFVAKHLGRRAVEMGAGSGYWASLLKLYGVDIICYDLRKEPFDKYYLQTFHRVRLNGPEKLRDISPKRSLFLCWPPYANPMAYDCLRNFMGDRVVFIGEGAGGCTGDDAFFELLESDFECVDDIRNSNYFGIHDYASAYKRKIKPGRETLQLKAGM